VGDNGGATSQKIFAASSFSDAPPLLLRIASLLCLHPSSLLSFNDIAIVVGNSSIVTHQHSSLFSQNHSKPHFSLCILWQGHLWNYEKLMGCRKQMWGCKKQMWGCRK